MISLVTKLGDRYENKIFSQQSRPCLLREASDQTDLHRMRMPLGLAVFAIPSVSPG